MVASALFFSALVCRPDKQHNYHNESAVLIRLNSCSNKVCDMLDRDSWLSCPCPLDCDCYELSGCASQLLSEVNGYGSSDGPTEL